MVEIYQTYYSIFRQIKASLTRLLPTTDEQTYPQRLLFQEAFAPWLFSAKTFANTKPPPGRSKSPVLKQFLATRMLNYLRCTALLASINLPMQSTSLPVIIRNAYRCWEYPYSIGNGCAFLAIKHLFSFFPPRTARHFPKVSKIMKHLLLPLVFSYNLTFKQV